MPSSPDRHGRDFRPDIEGLRGLAVLVVVLFHAGLAGIGGGFVGVDVFFVLSGFLITGLLVREGQRAGRIDLLTFYARRIRRLVPAAVVVLVATGGAAALLLDPLSRIDVLLDGSAAALSVANIRFALGAGDYFAPAGGPSPFLQFWSLGVEEQFYLAWPLLLLVAIRTRHPRLMAAVVLLVVGCLSFAANLLVIGTEPAWAFYSLPTRAWQLALGGLLAIGGTFLTRLPAPGLAAVGWLGLGAVGVACLTYDAAMLYPGAAALLPTLGAVALIAGGQARGGPGRWLSTGPFRFLGRISYSLYLWHWPVLILAPVALGTPELAPPVVVAAVALAVGLATVTCRLIEEPIRFGLGPRRPASAFARPTLAAGLTAIVAVALVGGGLSATAAREVDRLTASSGMPAAWLPAPQAAMPGPSSSTPSIDPEPTEPPIPPVLSGPAAPGGAAAPRPVPAASAIVVAIATPTPTPAIATPSGGTPIVTPAPGVGSGPALPPGLLPPLARAASDEERLKADRCIAYERAVSAPECAYGPAGAFTIALVGDSHASHWFPALEAVASARGWRIVPFVKVSCPFIDIAVRSSFFKREYTECATFRESTVARLAALKPGLTIVAQNKWVQPMDPADGRVEVIGASLARMLARIPGPRALLVDTPHAGMDVPTCLAANPGNIAACATPRARAMWGVGGIESAAARSSGAPTIDLRSHVCVADPCPAVVSGMIVYRDHHHLTATFSRSLAPALAALLGPLTGG